MNILDILGSAGPFQTAQSPQDMGSGPFQSAYSPSTFDERFSLPPQMPFAPQGAATPQFPPAPPAPSISDMETQIAALMQQLQGGQGDAQLGGGDGDDSLEVGDARRGSSTPNLLDATKFGSVPEPKQSQPKAVKPPKLGATSGEGDESTFIGRLFGRPGLAAFGAGMAGASNSSMRAFGNAVQGGMAYDNSVSQGRSQAKEKELDTGIRLVNAIINSKGKDLMERKQDFDEWFKQTQESGRDARNTETNQTRRDTATQRYSGSRPQWSGSEAHRTDLLEKRVTSFEKQHPDFKIASDPYMPQSRREEALQRLEAAKAAERERLLKAYKLDQPTETQPQASAPKTRSFGQNTPEAEKPQEIKMEGQGTDRNPYKPKTNDDYNQVESGSYYVRPLDGTVRIKP